MCAACIDFKDPDAPPVKVLIAMIKVKLRRQRRIKWGARAATVVCGFFVCFFTLNAFNGTYWMAVFAVLDLFMAWRLLRVAEVAAGRADHTLDHLRRTEALDQTKDTA